MDNIEYPAQVRLLPTHLVGRQGIGAETEKIFSNGHNHAGVVFPNRARPFSARVAADEAGVAENFNVFVAVNDVNVPVLCLEYSVDVFVGQPEKRGGAGAFSIEVGEAMPGGQPEAALAGRGDVRNDQGGNAFCFGEGRKFNVGKLAQPMLGAHPEVSLLVFGKSGHVIVGQAILLEKSRGCPVLIFYQSRAGRAHP